MGTGKGAQDLNIQKNASHKHRERSQTVRMAIMKKIRSIGKDVEKRVLVYY